MQIAQRGTSFSLAASTPFASGYILDRWQTTTSANQACTVSRVLTNDTTNLPNIQYAMRYQRNSGQTGTTGITLAQNFETINSIPFAGKTVTLSFYARAGANYSATSNALQYTLFTGTGTDQNAFAGYTGAASPISSSATLTATWQRFTATGTIAATATEMAMTFLFIPTNTTGPAGAADYYELTGVQLDIGSVALPFRTNAPTLQGELAACQRYYYRQSSGGYSYLGTAVAQSATVAIAYVPYPVTMRTNPTAIDYSSIQFFDAGANAVFNAPTIAIGVNASTNGMPLTMTGLSGLTQYRSGNIVGNSGYLGISAEL
jgi:hypothetical protein